MKCVPPKIDDNMRIKLLIIIFKNCKLKNVTFAKSSAFSMFRSPYHRPEHVPITSMTNGKFDFELPFTSSSSIYESRAIRDEIKIETEKKNEKCKIKWKYMLKRMRWWVTRTVIKWIHHHRPVFSFVQIFSCLTCTASEFYRARKCHSQLRTKAIGHRRRRHRVLHVDTAPVTHQTAEEKT